ncbi:hypothetical protein BH10PSE14_BH10PSE14_22240 [soil metagenome]
MAATRILWGQVILVLAIVLGAPVAATQTTAAALGTPWFTAFRHPVYPPYEAQAGRCCSATRTATASFGGGLGRWQAHRGSRPLQLGLVPASCRRGG